MSTRKKKNTFSLIGLAIILVLGPMVYFGLIRPHKTVASWFNDGWHYRKAITITNSGAADANKKVKFDIDTATLYSAGKIKINCDDSRFTDANGKQLQYYLDSGSGACNTNSTDYYVLMPTINAGTTTIYHYYGNPSATKGSENAQFSQATFSQSATATAAEEISKAPIAYWDFDEGYGSTVNDSSSNKNNGTLGAGNSAPAWQTEDMCVSGKCLKFDGSNDYISSSNFPNVYNFNGAFTVSFWFNQNTLTGNKTMISNWRLANIGGVSNHGMFVERTTVANKTLRFVYRNNGANVFDLRIGNIYSVNQWNHVIAVYDPSLPSANAKIYLNGIQGDTTTNATTTFAITGRNLLIGSLDGGTDGYGRYFNGLIDEVKIYPYARSAREIKADYNAGKSGQGSSKGSAASLGGPSAGSGRLADGLIGYWKMDENTGTSLADSSGNTLTGTLGTGTSAPGWVGGMFGTGLSFDSAGDTVTISGTASSVKTVSFWVKPSSTTNYFVDLNGTNSISASGGTLSATNFTSPAIYVNGSLSSTIASGSWQQVVVTTDTGITANAIKIGKIAANHLNGLIDEVRIYNRALSPAEVRQLYEWAPGPVAYYNFNEGVGSSAFDSSGYSNNGAWSGTGTHWATGKFGKAGKFNGSSDYVDLGSNLAIGTGVRTFEFWLKIPSSTTGTISVIGNRNNNASGYIIQIESTNVMLYNAVSATRIEYDSSLWWDGNWHHFAIVRAGTGSNAIYVDGVSRTLTVNTENLSNPNDALATRIGVQVGPSGDFRFFNGSIDDVKIYNYARSQKQIVEDMNAGHPAVGSPVGSAVAHYKFDEGYGTTVHNSGSAGSPLSGNLGTGNSAPTWSQNGKFGKALSFDGNDWVSFPDAGY